MVQSDKYYKSRAVGVASKVNLTTVLTEIFQYRPCAKKHSVFYISEILEITWYEQLYNTFIHLFDLLTVCIHHHHHHHVVPLAWISLNLSRHFSLSFIVSGRSSGLHPVSSHSCCMYVRACRPPFAQPYVGVHRRTSLMSSSLQQCPACLVRLTWIVFVFGSWWPYSWCLVGCSRKDLFNIARNILM